MFKSTSIANVLIIIIIVIVNNNLISIKGFQSASTICKSTLISDKKIILTLIYDNNNANASYDFIARFHRIGVLDTNIKQHLILDIVPSVQQNRPIAEVPALWRNRSTYDAPDENVVLGYNRRFDACAIIANRKQLDALSTWQVLDFLTTVHLYRVKSNEYVLASDDIVALWASNSGLSTTYVRRIHQCLHTNRTDWINDRLFEFQRKLLNVASLPPPPLIIVDGTYNSLYNDVIRTQKELTVDFLRTILYQKQETPTVLRRHAASLRRLQMFYNATFFDRAYDLKVVHFDDWTPNYRSSVDVNKACWNLEPQLYYHQIIINVTIAYAAEHLTSLDSVFDSELFVLLTNGDLPSYINLKLLPFWMTVMMVDGHPKKSTAGTLPVHSASYQEFRNHYCIARFLRNNPRSAILAIRYLLLNAWHVEVHGMRFLHQLLAMIDAIDYATRNRIVACAYDLRTPMADDVHMWLALHEAFNLIRSKQTLPILIVDEHFDVDLTTSHSEQRLYKIFEFCLYKMGLQARAHQIQHNDHNYRYMERISARIY